MKTKLIYLFFIALTGESIFAAPAACTSLFVSPTPAWRSQTTNEHLVEVKTNSSREKKMKDVEKEMKADILKQRTTPMMELFQAAGVRFVTVVDTPGYGSGVIQKYKIIGLDKTGEFTATLALPVSGHTGADNAKRWATTDTYQIWITRGNKAKTSLVGVRNSLGIVTFQDVKIKMNKGETINIAYDRSGSAGPGGYLEGRNIQLVWNGN